MRGTVRKSLRFEIWTMVVHGTFKSSISLAVADDMRNVSYWLKKGVRMLLFNPWGDNRVYYRSEKSAPRAEPEGFANSTPFRLTT